ncbi:MAG: murein L,D-transpeptidase catalytic domain family protein [Parafilimonas sp.]|nr:murein L,D-transpeptidase catalytic domain family protein [Parafilimonas sp.]
MKKLVFASAVCIVLFTSMIAVNKTNADYSNVTKKEVTNGEISNSVAVNYWIDSLYNSMNLNATGLSRSVFFTACKGYEYLLSQNKLLKQGLLTICDYSQSSSKKRLIVLDLNQGKILFNTYVAHGHNSGNDFATTFSNSDDSHKTSLGFMVTAETYNGDNGYSMRLDGMESGFNNNVRARAIVMHGSNYVNSDRAASGVMMGRSFGCPAVPAAEVKNIIDCIKGGSCFFSYYPDKNYTKASKIINADFNWPVMQSLQIASVKIPDSLKNLSLTGMQVN